MAVLEGVEHGVLEVGGVGDRYDIRMLTWYHKVFNGGVRLVLRSEGRGQVRI